jgi:hypothetical protein
MRRKLFLELDDIYSNSISQFILSTDYAFNGDPFSMNAK